MVVRHVSAVSGRAAHATYVAHYERAAGRGVAAAVAEGRALSRLTTSGYDGAWSSTEWNRKLEAYLDRDHQIGHSYFMGLNGVADLRFAWEHKVMPLLQEYFYGDGEKLLAVLGAKFVQTETIKLGSGDSANDQTVYRVQSITDDAAFVQALTELANS